MMEQVYIAHPVLPLPGSTETVLSNLDDAEWWFTNLQRANPCVAFTMDWALELRLKVGRDEDPEERAAGIARAVARAARCTGIAICGPRIGSGSLAETRGHAEDRRRVNVIHRFSRRDQDLVLPPRHRLLQCDFSDITPVWLRRCLFGACPQSVEIVGAEILAAIEREAVAT